MSGEPQGLFSFPGIQQFKSASYSRVHGVGPSVIRVQMVPQENFPARIGDVVLSFGERQVTLPNCIADYASARVDENGWIVAISLIDRRWKWVTGPGAISGHYNLRNDDGTIKPETVMTPQALAKLVFKAMGEANFDVGDLPNSARPLTEWEFARPDLALDELCDELGCHVVYELLTDRMAIRRVGIGANLPTGNIIETSLTLNPPEIPDKIAAIPSPTRFQCDLILEAVGIDGDGNVKPINQLRYTPKNGWGSIDLPFMEGVTLSFNDRELARETVFRWYRVQIPNGGLSIPGYVGPNVQALEYILPLLPFQNFTVPDPIHPGGVTSSNRPASIHGVFIGGYDADFINALQIGDPGQAAKLRPEVEAQGAKYYKSFTIDSKHGIVKFDEPVFSNSNANDGQGVSIAPAQLRLRCCVVVRDPVTRGTTRYNRVRKYANNGTQGRYLMHDEVILSAIPTYDQSYNVTSVSFNYAAVDAELDYYLNAAELEYEFAAPLTNKYYGIPQVELDGAISQVSIDISQSGCTTTVSRNTEQLHRVLPYRERRIIERLNGIIQPRHRNKPTLKKRNYKFNVEPLPANFWGQP